MLVVILLSCMNKDDTKENGETEEVPGTCAAMATTPGGDSSCPNGYLMTNRPYMGDEEQLCLGARLFFGWRKTGDIELVPGSISWTLDVLASPEADIELQGITPAFQMADPSSLAGAIKSNPGRIGLMLEDDIDVGPAAAVIPENMQLDELQALFLLEEFVVSPGECVAFTWTVDDNGVTYLNGDWIVARMSEHSSVNWNDPETIKDGNLSFGVRVREDSAPFDNYHYLDFISTARTTVDGEAALVFEAPEGYCDGPGCGAPFIAYSVKRTQGYYNLVFYGDTKLDEVEKSVFSSFKWE